MAREINGMLAFPDNFEWGTATASFQIEGGASDRGRCIWDAFCAVAGNVDNGDDGKVACDHYHRYEDDVALMKQLGVKNYRFSLSWPRLFPNGRVEDGVNEKGRKFYNDLIDCLIRNGITPVVTLYHWDLPLALESEIGGWLSPAIAPLFGQYADKCFAMFGDRVKTWLTLNEPWCCSVLGYSTGEHAPGRTSNPGHEVYRAGHNLLLAHAEGVNIYRQKYQKSQKGRIGLTLNTPWWEPHSDSQDDVIMANRAMDFFLGWFADPITFGDYPAIMKEVLKDRLPTFSAEERKLLKGSTDFFGLNHYSSSYAAHPTTTRVLVNAVSEYIEMITGGGGTKAIKKMMCDDYFKDAGMICINAVENGLTDMGWSIAPWGVRKLLEYTQQKYYPAGGIYLFENGMAVKEMIVCDAVMDTKRINFMHDYLVEIHKAMRNGANLRGYFYWSFLDNFEWAFGYSKRFGLVHVDYKTQQRTPKASAHWYSQVMVANGLVKPCGKRVGEEFVGEMEKRGQLSWVQSCRDEERKLMTTLTHAHGHGLASHQMLVALMLIVTLLSYTMMMS
jgi:beta-glucosidase/6-phospho-beta-glucosidase/beta-galactosidase